jgi:hypothetical protein
LTIERLTKYFILSHQHLLHFRFELALFNQKIKNFIFNSFSSSFYFWSL